MSTILRLDKPQKVDLGKVDTEPPHRFEREAAEAKTEELGAQIEELQDLLFYAGRHALLIVLQGMDTSGKDGTIRHLLRYSDAQSTRVAPFKVPTPEEIAHDFLWRCHKQTPARGEITVFNRSHYEDVLVVRVHSLVPEEVWSARYKLINDFEALLASSDTIILKFFLHLGKDEQERRLLEREQDVETAWKLSVGDWKERELWHEYRKAYEDALGKCAARHAPWIVVPADKKWYRNLVVTQAIVDELQPYKEGWLKSLAATGEKAKQDLAAYRATLPKP